jgi:DNA repair protein RecN (Recombination protein N)
VIPQILDYLGMSGSRFKVALQYQNDPTGLVELQGQTYKASAIGMDVACFSISTNSGEEIRPLVKVASGGEISRIMLALKSVLAREGQIPVLIFDEIDGGISGRIAQAVGRKLKELAEHHQVICITHLPQIASMGDNHWYVEKAQGAGRTYTSIRKLTAEQRTEEIAKLLAGEKVSQSHLEGARQLIKEATAD